MPGVALGALDRPLLVLLGDARRAVLATVRPDGRPRLVPISYAADIGLGVLYSALDDKPKSVGDPRRLARVRDIAERPQVSVLIDRWSEDWNELAWLRIDGLAGLLEPAERDHADEHAGAVERLRERYPQYASQPLEERPIVRIAVEGATGWVP